MGLLDWGKTTRNEAYAPEPDPRLPAGSKLDTVPAMDAYHLSEISVWLDEWFAAVEAGDNSTMRRLLNAYGEALGSNGTRATFQAVQHGVDGREPRQRPWRWLGLAADAANEGDYPLIPVKIFYFLVMFESSVRPWVVRETGGDGFIDMGIDPPSVHSKYVIADRAIMATLDIQEPFVEIPGGKLSVRDLSKAAVRMAEEAEQELAADGGIEKQRFNVGHPIDRGVWKDSKSGKFRFGRRIGY